MDSPTAANILGTFGAVCWSIQLIPQILLNYHRHSTTGLQPTMMLLWATAGLPLGTYNILSKFNIPLLIQPQILTLLSLITWAQCKYYSNQWPIRRILLALLPTAMTMAAAEIGLVFTLRKAISHDMNWPKPLMAILAASLLCLGVLRHYLDIYRSRTVRGISFVFVALDALGDLSSLLSILFEKELSVLGMVMYASELTLWLGVFACGGWYNFVPWVKRKRSQLRNKNARALSTPSGTELEGIGASTAVADNTSIRSNTSSRSAFRTASRHVDQQQTMD